MNVDERVVSRILKQCPFFEFAGHLAGKSSAPRFRHTSLDISAVLIPSGRFTMGLSKREENVARNLCDPPPLDLDRMRPIHQVHVRQFLVSDYPLLQRVDTRLNDPSFVVPDTVSYPATVGYHEAVDFARELDARLPTEEEWEYMCRANTKTLFFWGDSLPKESDLERIVQFDMAKELTPNPFGLYGVFSGEWCQGEYRSSYLAETPCTVDVHPVRGGASQLWPWQSHEWTWCVSANRMPSSDLFDAKACFRLVWQL